MTVGIIDHTFVEKQLLNYAAQQNNQMLGVVTYATAYTLSQSEKSVKFLRGRMEDAGCPKGTIDVCFAIAKVIAPSIEEAVKTCEATLTMSASDVALVEIQNQIVAAKGVLSWKDLKAKLSGKGDTTQKGPIRSNTAPGPVRFIEPEAPEVVQQEVPPQPEHVEPVAEVEATADSILDSFEDYGALFEGIIARTGPEAWDAMAEALVAARLAWAEVELQQAA